MVHVINTNTRFNNNTPNPPFLIALLTWSDLLVVDPADCDVDPPDPDPDDDVLPEYDVVVGKGNVVVSIIMYPNIVYL